MTNLTWLTILVVSLGAGSLPEYEACSQAHYQNMKPAPKLTTMLTAINEIILFIVRRQDPHICHQALVL